MENRTETQFYGPNLGYVLELYERFKEDPDSVDERTRSFFEEWGPPQVPGTNGRDGNAPAAAPEVDVLKVVAATKYVRAIRDFGHRAARLDPLGSEPPGDPALDLAFYRISIDELESLPANITNAPGTGPIPERTDTAREAVEELGRLYCRTTGYDFGHIHSPDERFWLREAVESERFDEVLEGEEARGLLKQLARVDTFEKFLHRTFLGQKRFSIEGLDMTVPMINTLIRSAADTGIPEVALGMAHRGRLNMLAHVLEKPYSKIFGEFQKPEKGEKPSVAESPGGGWVGDVKYHLGIRGFHLGESEEDSKVAVNLTPNPSHLEVVDPVVEGMARAVQETRDEAGTPKLDEEASLPILLHGDAAFPGEGVVPETLNLSRLPGYQTGGTIHIITNNQIGFTTEKQDARSTTYASDPAKGYEMPVVHVNADDPEACLAAARLAYAYRQEFGKDFVIDLIGYRRFGHNEGDEPTYTQPKMYEIINNHPTVREVWAKTLEERGVVSEGEAQEMVDEIYGEMQETHKNPDEVGDEDLLTDEPYTPLVEVPETAVPAERLSALNEALLQYPEGFNPNPKLDRLLRKSRGELDDIDWGHAEALAFASLLEDGVPIRITGQDTERGTFSHRHAVLTDVESGEAYIPLQNLPSAKASFDVHNSPLSEVGPMGFEYGYTLRAPEAMVLWEAQFGDFANVAQPIIDQFIVSAQLKWGQTSRLVLLLPHGYEGQGPEHSSARLERFLQLAAHDNIRIAYCTTAAQYFHLLRAQAVLADQQRPLVVMTPKSLLRHPLAASKLEDLSEGKFRAVLDDEEMRQNAESVERLVLCTGKIYTELVASEAREQDEVTAVARVELLYPFPKEDVKAVIAGYPNLREVVWTQEEPQNMGAWFFMEPLLRDLVDGELPVRYVGKPARPSPAQGSAGFHKKEHAKLVRAAFKGADDDVEKENAPEDVQEKAPTAAD